MVIRRNTIIVGLLVVPFSLAGLSARRALGQDNAQATSEADNARISCGGQYELKFQ